MEAIDKHIDWRNTMEQTFENLVAPVKALNELTCKSIEQIAAIQLKTIQENARISVDSLKSTTGIKDLDSLKSYLENQATVAQNLYDKTVKDAQEIAKVSETYATDVRALVEKSVRTV